MNVTVTVECTQCEHTYDLEDVELKFNGTFDVNDLMDTLETEGWERDDGDFDCWICEDCAAENRADDDEENNDENNEDESA